MCGTGDELNDDEVEPGGLPYGWDSPNRGDGDEPIDRMEAPDGGFMRFSFWRRLQNHTLTTSFSIIRLSDRRLISSDVGLGFWRNARSRDTRTVVSMDVRFLRRRPLMDSGVE
jgi:hypothetical protein